MLYDCYATNMKIIVRLLNEIKADLRSGNILIWHNNSVFQTHLRKHWVNVNENNAAQNQDIQQSHGLCLLRNKLVPVDKTCIAIHKEPIFILKFI